MKGTDFSHIMGNKQGIGVHDCYVYANGRAITIPSAWLTKTGKYKVKYRGVIQSMIRGLNEARIAA